MVEPRRKGAYERLRAQLGGLIAGEGEAEGGEEHGRSPNLLSAMATVVALLHAKLSHHSWTGFYFFDGEETLTVGPYQGPVACQVLKGRGVCLAAAKSAKAVVVPDVEAFPGHIACDGRTKSEIVLPVMKEGRVVAVLDIDSHELGRFDEDDIPPLTSILSLLSPYI